MAHHKPISTGPADHRYLRIEDLRRLRHLAFASKRVVEGQYAGQHASPQRGHSVEFNDYREYMPGDEISEIDWKVYGRSDKLFVKLFEHQSDLSVNLLIDASASMDYRGVDRRGSMGESALAGSATSTSSGGGGDRQSWLEEVSLTKQKRTTGRDRATIEHPSKYDQACLMAAAIAFLVTKQQDRVGFGVAQRGLEHCHRPLGTIAHLNNVLETMERVRPGGEAHLAETLRAVAQRTSRRGLLVVFSDLLEDQDSIMRALAIFTHRGNEVIVFQVLHADELRLPDLASAVFVDSETDQRLRLNVDDVAPAYEKRLNDFLSGWAGACRNRGIDYNLVSTATAYHKAMERYLFGRANRM